MANREKRSWQPREMQMLSEWLRKVFPKSVKMTRVRLGSPKPAEPKAYMSPEELAMIGAWRRWADALIIEEDRVILVEAAIRPEPGDISKLELYRMLLPATPELAEHKAKKIDLVLLYAIEDAATILLARQHGIACIEYKPEWLPSYMELLMPRERRGVRL